jgi:hypothetical protein
VPLLETSLEAEHSQYSTAYLAKNARNKHSHLLSEFPIKKLCRSSFSLDRYQNKYAFELKIAFTLKDMLIINQMNKMVIIIHG